MGSCQSAKRNSQQGDPVKGSEMQLSEEDAKKEFFKKERALQAELRDKSLPILERRLSVDDFQTMDMPERANTEALMEKRQNEAWRRKLMDTAAKESHWVVFSNKELFDANDLEILHDFTDKIMNKIPDSFWEMQQHRQASAKLDTITEASRENSSNSIIVSSRENSAQNLVRLDTIKIKVDKATMLAGDRTNYEIPSGVITEKVASDIIKLYMEGGRLRKSSVHKLLRHAFAKLKDLPNTITLSINQSSIPSGSKPTDERITIVGDIHGQLQDLLHIIDEAGFPGPKHKYVFNGDFVDRGPQSVEVMCVLLALFNAFPDYVVLNRGNHEEFAICCAYGFQVEVYEKYDDITFGMFCELFRHLPLFVIINNSILVLHGGLFHRQGVKISELNDIDRANFDLRDATDPSLVPSTREEYLHTLQRDALWSDPQIDDGIVFNYSRGAGISFGSDIVDFFLAQNNLKLIIRSHECVAKGFDLPFAAQGKITLCTIFSASNYSGTNDGAYMQIVSTEGNPSATTVQGTDLSFNVFQYNIVTGSPLKKEVSQAFNLQGLLVSKVNVLRRAFEAADIRNTNTVSVDTWAAIVSSITKIKIHWSAIAYRVVPNHAFDGENINYAKFLDAIRSDERSDSSVKNEEEETFQDTVDAIYTEHRKLDTIFHFFDPEDTGLISKDAFQSGCLTLSNTLPLGHGITQVDEVFSLMDITCDKSISVNEFFEIFRIVEKCKKQGVARSPSIGVSQNISAEGNTLVIHGIVINIDSDRECVSRRMPELILKKTSEKIPAIDTLDIPISF